MSFGQALRQAREEFKWTQPELADAIALASDGKIRLTPAEVSRYERGVVKNPRLEVIRAAAKATGRPIEEFLNSVAEDGVAVPLDGPFRGASVDDGGGDSDGARGAAA